MARLSQDAGLLILRIGLGLSYMIIHGWPKLSGGAERWEGVGGAMSYVGIDFFPVVWGFMASAAEFFGGLLIMLGLLFRPAAVALAATMVVATIFHLGSGDGLSGSAHSLKMAVVFIGLFFIGPGRYNLDAMISRR